MIEVELGLQLHQVLSVGLRRAAARAATDDRGRRSSTKFCRPAQGCAAVPEMPPALTQECIAERIGPYLVLIWADKR